MFSLMANIVILSYLEKIARYFLTSASVLPSGERLEYNDKILHVFLLILHISILFIRSDCSVLKMRTEIFKEKRRIELSGNSAIPFVIKQPVPVSVYPPNINSCQIDTNDTFVFLKLILNHLSGKFDS